MNWIDGPPTEPGLVVLEWGNAGGLEVYVVFRRDGKLVAYDCEFGNPRKGPHDLNQWYIRRHLVLPRPASDNLNYEIYNPEFNLETGKFVFPEGY